MSTITVSDPRLEPVSEKLLRGERLTRGDALAVYESTDLLGIGELANYVREQRHGVAAWCRLDLNPPPVLEGDNETRIAHLLEMEAVETYEVALRPHLTGHTYLKDVAVARLLLPGAVHIQARLCPAVENVCQLALRFGADTLVGPDVAELERQAKACGREVASRI
jgi:2-iminoacetate synthase ThiH